MTVRNLPTEDQEQLEQMWEAWFSESDLKELNLKEIFDRQIEILMTGGMPENEARRKLEGIFDQLFSAKGASQLPFLDGVLEYMFDSLPEVRNVLEQTVLFVVPTFEHRAFWSRLHSGVSYIAITLSMLVYPGLAVTVAVECILSMGALDIRDAHLKMTWIIDYARKYRRSDRQLLVSAIPSYSRSENKMSRVTATLAFILLHEIAHIALGHRPTEDVEVSWQQEYDADKRAFEWWMELWEKPLPEKDATMIVTSIFGFFSLADSISGTRPKSHPSPSSRLHKLLELPTSSDFPEDLKSLLLEFWNTLENIAKENPDAR